MRKNVRQEPWLAFLFASLICLSCSWFAPRSSLTLKVDPKVVGTKAPSRVDYDCYLVSVSGPGISPVVAGNDIGSYAPDCLAPGVSSRMVSGTVIRSPGVSVIIPAGAKRRISVIGVVTSLHAACENNNLTKVFEDGRKPELYELAVKESDLFKDTLVKFATTDVIASPTNLLGTCFPTTPPTFNPANLERVQIVTRNNDSIKTLQNFTLSETGALTLEESLPLPGFPDRAQPNRDSSRILFWGRTISGLVRQIAFGLSGNMVDEGVPATTGSFHENNQLAFSDTNKYLYLASNEPGHVVQLKYEPELKANDPLSANLGSSFTAHWVWGSTFHWLYDSGGTYSYRAEIPTATFALPQTPPFSASGISLSDTAGGKAVLRGNTGLYLTYQVLSPIGFELAYYSFSAGTFLQVGAPHPIGESTSPGNIQMALDPKGKYLFVKYRNTGVDRLSSYVLGTDGAILRKTNLDFVLSDFVDMVVDHRGKFLVYGGALAGASYLSACPIIDSDAASGELSACTPFGSTIAQNLGGILSVPISR